MHTNSLALVILTTGAETVILGKEIETFCTPAKPTGA